MVHVVVGGPYGIFLRKAPGVFRCHFWSYAGFQGILYRRYHFKFIGKLFSKGVIQFYGQFFTVCHAIAKTVSFPGKDEHISAAHIQGRATARIGLVGNYTVEFCVVVYAETYRCALCRTAVFQH